MIDYGNKQSTFNNQIMFVGCVGWTSSWSLALRERHEPVLR